MLTIFRNRDILKNIGLRSIRKYSANQEPSYDCPHQQGQLSEAERRKNENGCADPCPEDCSHSNKSLFYKRLFFFVCIPLIMSSYVYTFYITEETQKRLPFIPYPYMYRRVKNFPWGDGKKTLFHNPKVNALPDGYETEEEDED